MNGNEAAPRKYPLAVKAGTALAALLSLWGTFEYLGFESAYQRQYADPYKIGAQFSRFDALRASVPENAVMGYLTDLAPESIAAGAMFGGAQYVLAPRLLERTVVGHDLVLGNFAKPDDFAALGLRYGLRMEHDFGNGVVLFRRESR